MSIDGIRMVKKMTKETKQKVKKGIAWISGAAMIVSSFAFFVPFNVSGATTYSLFDDASIVATGNPGNAAQLVSDADPGWGGVDFENDTVSTLSDLTNLATDYNFTENSCGSGSPRFQIGLDNGSGDTGNIFVYLGPAPNYTLCPEDVWTSSGNLVTAASLVDTSQLDGGTFYDPYSSALTKYGNYEVTAIQLVTDSGWAFEGDQIVLVDNVEINSDITTFDVEETDPALNAEDFGVVDYDTGLGQLRGYTAGFGLTDATLEGAQSVVVELYGAGDQLLQTNTAIISKFNADITGTQFSSPFDVSGDFDYVADGYWTNDREDEYGQSVPAVKVVATVTLEDGTVVTAENTNLTGDPSTIFPEDEEPVVPVTKDECMNGGWMTLADSEGNAFKNQGDCVSFVASKGKNKGNLPLVN